MEGMNTLFLLMITFRKDIPDESIISYRLESLKFSMVGDVAVEIYNGLLLLV